MPRVLSDGRTAPSLRVRFRCPVCKVGEVRDAYEGPALCGCRKPRPIMVGEQVVSELDVPEPVSHPDAKVNP